MRRNSRDKRAFSLFDFLPKNVHTYDNKMYYASKNSWLIHFAIIKQIFYIKGLFSSVQISHSVVFDSATLWIAACQASLSTTISRSSLKLTSIESVMPSSHLILCRPLLLLPPIPPSIRVFSNESTLHMKWPKYWSFSFSINLSNEHPTLISF